MKRRDFIRVMAGGSAVVLVPSVLTACSDDPGLEGWNGPMASESDIRRIVLSYAILAPNPHNKQPWIVDLTGPTSLDLYVDQSRLLQETDPPFRQIHIAQGTFLENLDLAARHHGYLAEIAYFPQGSYGNTVVENQPVASVNLVENQALERDPLFDQILRRQTNRRNYDETPLSADQLSGLRDSFTDAGLTLTVTDDAAQRNRVAQIMIDAMRIETAGKARDAESIAMFRFNADERARYRDGFGVAQVGITGIGRWIAETFFLSREDVENDSTSFGEQAVDLTSEQARSASALGWIVTASNQRLDQLATGRAYERLNLTATALGMAMHPLSQVLQEYPDMAELQEQFLAYLGVAEGHTVQMLFRFGMAEPVGHSAWRRVEDIIPG